MKTSSLILSTILSFGLSAQANAPRCAAVLQGTLGSAIETLAFRLGPGRVVSVQIAKSADPGMPTVLLMPGVNRSILLEQEAPQKMIAQGFSVVSFQFSAQPFSVASLPKGEKPGFANTPPSLQDFAEETRALVKGLEARGFTNVIPVSLSYSGAVSPSLRGFPLVIETAPLTSTAAQNPQLESYRQSLKAAELFNPFFGASITRSSLDTAYRQVWNAQVDALVTDFKMPADRKADMVDGYLSLSRAAEGFEWKIAELPAETKRAFILAGNEAGPLFRHQLQTVKSLFTAKRKVLLYIILEAGHVIPADQPEIYAQVVRQIVMNQAEAESGVVVVTPSKGEFKATQGENAVKVIDRFLESGH